MENNLIDAADGRLFWDCIFITAANEAQAEAVRGEIEKRKENKRLPEGCAVEVIPDAAGKRNGSGAATLKVIEFAENKFAGADFFKTNRCLLIHSGGENSRTPCCTVCGKLFMPYPDKTADNPCTTLFDRILEETLKITALLSPGLFITVGDMLPDFGGVCSADFPRVGEAFAVTCLKTAEFASNHGVYASDENAVAKDFFHKQSAAELKAGGAVDENGMANVDTGCLFLPHAVIDALRGLYNIKEPSFKNADVCLSLYGDFIYPFVSQADFEVYKGLPAERNTAEEMLPYRRVIFGALSRFSLRVLNLGSAGFVHLGTEREIIAHLFKISGTADSEYLSVGSAVAENAQVGAQTYLEFSRIGENTAVGKGCVISHAELDGVTVPDATSLYVQRLADGNFVAYVYTAGSDEIKAKWNDKSLCVEATAAQAVKAALALKNGETRKSDEYISCSQVLCRADVKSVFTFRESMALISRAAEYGRMLSSGAPFSDIDSVPYSQEKSARFFRALDKLSAQLPFSGRIRVLAWLSLFAQQEKEQYSRELFSLICSKTDCTVACTDELKIKKDFVSCALPLRINWAGGWSDTPPYCYENPGAVLNSSVKVNGISPVNVTVKRLPEKELVFLCADDKIRRKINSLEELFDCRAENDRFSLHKAALVAFGAFTGKKYRTLDGFIEKIGGGFCLSTAAYGIPRGSGMGTSSILLTACMKVLSSFFGVKVTNDRLYRMVLCAEQLMGTGGGWQDSVGGLVEGTKLITCTPETLKRLNIARVELTESAHRELSDRLCLVYTGKKRLARYILRNVVVKYLSGEPQVMAAYEKTKALACEMAAALQAGDVDLFASLMNEQWQCAVIIDESCSDELIVDIFDKCSSLLAGKMICGAGGGGFLQMLLKRGCTKEDLCCRLESCFPDEDIHCMDIELM